MKDDSSRARDEFYQAEQTISFQLPGLSEWNSGKRLRRIRAEMKMTRHELMLYLRHIGPHSRRLHLGAT